MATRIALAGNPNCGKTTLFNSLTGSNQYVGNWPGVTVEKKEGKLKGADDVIVTDLPGIYSLSPYTSEEVISRDYLITDKPDAILNIVDATNIERNLYLTTQLLELGRPTAIALNMMDVLKKTGDTVNIEKLQDELGCVIIETSALKGTNVKKAADEALKSAKTGQAFIPKKIFSSDVEKSISDMEALLPQFISPELKRWYAIKLIERDSVVLEQLSLSESDRAKAEAISANLEKAKDDDTESIITNERYEYIQKIVNRCVKKSRNNMTLSDKIDRIVTNRWLGIPIFLCVMWIVYYIAVSSLGTVLTDWANDGLFGDGWHLFGIGSAAYNEDVENYEYTRQKISAYLSAAEKNGFDVSEIREIVFDEEADKDEIRNALYNAPEDIQNFDMHILLDDFEAAIKVAVPNPSDYENDFAGYETALDTYKTAHFVAEEFLSQAKEAGIMNADVLIDYISSDDDFAALLSENDSDAVSALSAFVESALIFDGFFTTKITYNDIVECALLDAPSPSNHGLWIPGISSAVESGLESAGVNEVVIDCIVNGVIGGIGAVLGFTPQMAILFLLLSIVEDCGYMVRIAFVMDRIFRRFGLSGKSFIPMLVSSGCGVPGIMASRTIENENDRRLTIMTATWIPCGAKLPVIALMAGVIGSKLTHWDGGSLTLIMYAIGIASVIIAAIMLKKTKPFHGKAAPFVMELPQYHIPQLKTVLLHTWERLRGFIIKAGTILFLACLVLWFLSSYGFASPKDAEIAEDGTIIEEAVEGGFGLVDANESLLALFGNGLRHIFIPLGFGGENGGWQTAAATISGFSAKEAIVSTMGVLANVSDDYSEEDAVVASNITSWFPTALAAFAFLLFNLLDSPCLAAIAAMNNELKSRKWFWFAILFQNIFAWIVTFIVYQLGMLFAHGQFRASTVFAIVCAAGLLYMLFRPNPYKKMESVSSK